MKKPLVCVQKLLEMNEKNFNAEIDTVLEMCDDFTYAEEIATIGNSFFDKKYFGTRVLVLAAKFGDEISVAGNTIFSMAATKAEIFVAYSEEKISTPENLVALKILGVPEDKIIFVKDLKQLILKLRANIIFCVDYDSVEHRKLSAAFEKAMGEILAEVDNYRPEVYKKLANATALNAPPDFYAPNLLSVKRPKFGATDNYDFDLIDRANYNWAERVRFPVHERCRAPLLKENPLASAILAYRQKNFSALRILNSDEIFFERRTDNQVFSAKVEASSGAADKVCDFQIFGESWQPSSKDDKKILRLEWDDAAQVRQIKIYGNILDSEPAKIKIRLDLENCIDKAGISLDNKRVFENILPAYGCPLVIDTDKIFVRRAEIELVEGGKNFGISEIEMFANVNPIRKIPPFVKLAVGKNFFYRYDIPYEVEKVLLNLYKFHVDEPVKITATSNGENILTEILDGNDELTLNLDDAKEIVLTAEVIGNPNIYDQAIIRRVGDLAQIQLKILQWLDKIRNSAVVKTT